VISAADLDLIAGQIGQRAIDKVKIDKGKRFAERRVS